MSWPMEVPDPPGTTKYNHFLRPIMIAWNFGVVVGRIFSLDIHPHNKQNRKLAPFEPISLPTHLRNKK